VSHPDGTIAAVGIFEKRLLELAAAQHLVVSRDQLLDLGGRHLADDRVRSGLIEPVHRGVYRIAGSPRTWRQDVMAACFAGGKLSVASFRTAAALHYLPGGEEIVEITSPRHRRSRHDGITAHESRFLTDLDIIYVDNIPVTRTARTLNDLGLLVEKGDLELATLDHAMHDAIRRSLVDVERVWREWQRLGGSLRPGGMAVETMLRRFVPPQGDVQTSPELRLLQLVRAAGLPEPVPQFRVWLSPTRWVDLDLAWPWLKLFMEFDSYKYHGNRDKFMRDAARRLRLRELGWQGVSVTDDELDAGGTLAIRVAHRLISEASLNLAEAG
jgi:hypothetical protein